MGDETIEFYRLTFVPEGPDVVVGRADTSSYAVLPLDGAQLLRQMIDGMSPTRAAAWYEAEFDEPVDMGDFLETIDELGFIRPADEPVQAVTAPRFQPLGRAVFSGPAWAGYLAVLGLWLWIASRHADLLPRPSQLFFTGSLVAVQAVVLLCQAPLALLHESFHVLAGQRLGLKSRLGISNRFTYVVIETKSNGLLGVPRNKRYLPFLAGMLIDLQIFCVLDLIAWATRAGDGSFPLAGRVCLALSFTVAARLGWQFLLYLRTDLYYVVATALNCHDLHAASKAIFFNRINRVLGRTHRLVDEDQWTERDRHIGTRYGWFLMLGFLAAFILTGVVTVPVIVIYIERLVTGLGSGPGWHLWDSVFSLSVIITSFVLPYLLARRKRRLDAGRAPRLLTDPGVS